jgi:hypothetical protein
MLKSVVSAVLAIAVFSPTVAQTNEFEENIATMWEVLWHQSGTPTRLVRWEQEMKVRVYGVNVAAHKRHTLQALKDVAAEAGIRVVDVSDRPDAAQLANVSVEITPDDMLEDRQPCVTYLNFETETTIDSAAMQMRGRDARRCAYHEAMHVMGLRGHPAGKTVLSYFPSKVDGLLPLDRAMLRAWYSPKMRGGMTPFEVQPVLADELVASMPDRNAAMGSREHFFRNTVDQMQAFAEGTGDVPMIVKRSGKSTEQGIALGRMEMSYFLGVAYLQGATVQADPGQAVRWLERAVSLGSRNAAARLGAPS